MDESHAIVDRKPSAAPAKNGSRRQKLWPPQRPRRSPKPANRSPRRQGPRRHFERTRLITAQQLKQMIQSIPGLGAGGHPAATSIPPMERE
jgi:hypothetical protein